MVLSSTPMETCYSQVWEMSGIGSEWGPELGISEEQSRTSVRSRARPYRWVEQALREEQPGLSGEQRLASEKQSQASRRRAEPQWEASLPSVRPRASVLSEVGPSEELIRASVGSRVALQCLEEPGLREVNSGLREEENRTSVRRVPGSVWTQTWPPGDWSQTSVRSRAGLHWGP